MKELVTKCTWIVVPCYNEAERISTEPFRWLVSQSLVGVIFVDDGSTDNTFHILTLLTQQLPSERVKVIRQKTNLGKAEAVRTGMLAAIDMEAELIGYLDADLATPVEEMIRLRDILIEKQVDAVLGSRVKILGTNIQRKAWRHYSGRAFATLAAWVLDCPVYDTQCGAKLFRNNSRLKAVLNAPFSSRWAFDVELLGRLLPLNSERIIEIPLLVWKDTGQSKLSFWAMIRTTFDLIRIKKLLHRWHSRKSA